MSFDYDKLKKKQEAGNQWTSYSDLFMVLSVVFLLLYVTASLRTGTHTLQQQIQNQRLAEKAQDLENQIKVYNALKQNYLEKQASMSEQKVYEQLMDKIKLLKEKNGQEASKLRAKALENEKKEAALNQYQQIVRNIINANVLAKARIKRKEEIVASQKTTIKDQVTTIAKRDQTIVERDKTIEDKVREIASLDEEVEQKKQIINKKDEVIAQKQKVIKSKQSEIKKLNKDISKKASEIRKNKNKISKINNDLDNRIKKLQQLRRKQKLSKKLYNIELKRIQAKSKRRVAALNQKNKDISKVLKTVESKVKNANKQLQSANKTIAAQQQQKQKLDQELNNMQSQIAQTKQEFEDSKKEYEQQIGTLKTQQDELKDQKSKLEAQAAQLAEQKDQLQNQTQKLQVQKDQLQNQKDQLSNVNQQLAQINNQLAQDKNQLASAQERLKKEREKLKAQQAQLSDANQNLSQELKKAQEVINAKKKLAKQIQDNFAKNGIKADVDGQTGEVVLSFGDSFFDTGKSHLKKDMKSTLNKFMPIYADSIFKDKKIAQKIKSVDIVGFSSPTFGGKYVNPNSLDPKDKRAIEYNTNLSIERAKAVFKHIIDTRKLKYTQQGKITPLLKVSGRSYFSGALSGRAPARDMSRKEFCKLYDCKKEQRVIIKFELDN